MTQEAIKLKFQASFCCLYEYILLGTGEIIDGPVIVLVSFAIGGPNSCNL